MHTTGYACHMFRTKAAVKSDNASRVTNGRNISDPLCVCFSIIFGCFSLRKLLLLSIFHHPHIQLQRGRTYSFRKFAIGSNRCICLLGIITEELRKAFFKRHKSHRVILSVSTGTDIIYPIKCHCNHILSYECLQG